MIRFSSILLSFVFFSSPAFLHSQNGRILIVHGSDTSVNGGLDVGKRHPTVTTSLYTQPGYNAHKIMNPAYRDTIVDSYGQPLIMTWWMLTGSMFRASTNTNVPYPSPLTLHLMKKYHAPSIVSFGDELTLHYHTWVWSDYDADGTFYWNQALSFTECQEEFTTVLAENLLEEENFPVSFRSGWHFMDNEWQNFLDQWIPFSLHNDYPAKRLVDTEPTDNIFDWSRAPSDWVPYHPSLTDYQVPGNARGWNVRSRSIEVVSKAQLEQAFIQAAQGKDQVLCLWDHLADDNIFPSLSRVNKLLHELSAQYGIPFEFKSATDAMQLWLGTADSLPPVLTFSENRVADAVTFAVETNEPIFQIHPFVAIKTIDEGYDFVEMTATGPTSWVSSSSYPLAALVKAAAAVTDTVGNLSTAFLRYLPDDIFVDNRDSAYQELRGSWVTVASSTWGADYRTAAIAAEDSAVSKWTFQAQETLPYKFSIQIPPAANRAQRSTVRLLTSVDTLVKDLREPLPNSSWIYVGTANVAAETDVTLEMTSFNEAGVSVNAGADVVKMSPLVRAYDLAAVPREINLGYASVGESLHVALLIGNQGTASQTIDNIGASLFSVSVDTTFPLILSPGSSVQLRSVLVFPSTGPVHDTIRFSTTDHPDDPLCIPVSAVVETVVRILDNDDPKVYRESGVWSTSVAVSYGATSRISYLNTGPGQYAAYKTAVPQEGYYNVFQLIPGSTNATDRALLTITQEGRVLDSAYVNQQAAEGWILVGVHRFSALDSIEIRVINDGTYTSGVVLRSDAIRISWKGDSVQTAFVVDNDGPGYTEVGTWSQSVAQAYGPTSRYANLDPVGQYAAFTTRVVLAGAYDVEQIVPSSVNATDHALYTIASDGSVIDSVYLNQTVGGGQWVKIGQYDFRPNTLVEVRVINAGGYTSGVVIRADAVRLTLNLTTSVQSSDFPKRFALEPNYPNPFNPETAVSYQLSAVSFVRLTVYDLLGREVAVLVNETLPAGVYKATWDASRFPSGVYLCRMQAGEFVAVRKMLLVK